MGSTQQTAVHSQHAHQYQDRIRVTFIPEFHLYYTVKRVVASKGRQHTPNCSQTPVRPAQKQLHHLTNTAWHVHVPLTDFSVDAPDVVPPAACQAQVLLRVAADALVLNPVHTKDSTQMQHTDSQGGVVIACSCCPVMQQHP